MMSIPTVDIVDPSYKKLPISDYILTKEYNCKLKAVF